MAKLRSFYYSLYKFKMRYSMDKEGMVVKVHINKPDAYVFGDERNALTMLVNHFTASGYCVLVED